MSNKNRGSHAARIARKLVPPDPVGDLRWAVVEGLKGFEDPQIRKLCTAIDSDYPAIKKKLDPLFDSLPDEFCVFQGIIEQAWFHIGFQAALRVQGKEVPHGSQSNE